MIATDKNKTMKHVRKWSEDKDSLVVWIALALVAFVNEYYELSKTVHDGKRLEGYIPIPSLRTWLKLYRNPKRIWKALLYAFGETNSDEKASGIIRNEIGKMISGSIEKRSDEANELIEKLKEEAINNFTSKVKQEERKEFLKNLTKPEMIFFIRVFAPCFSFYKTYPIELLRRAQSGNDKALDKLIRLDKSAIFAPKISEIVHQAQVLKAQARMSMIKKAFTSPPNAMKMDAIKCQMGGLVSFITDLLKHKLKPSDIKKLYDAIAKDLKVDMLHDPDLHEMTVPAFAKRINRASSMWKSIVIQDK